MLASDPTTCPHCQHEAGRRSSGLGSTDSGQEGSGSGFGEAEADGDEPRSSEDGASSELAKEDEEEQVAGAAWLCGAVWRETRAKLRSIVDSKYFSRGIMMAILVNTVSMGIEHHEQASVGPPGRQAWAVRGWRGVGTQAHAQAGLLHLCVSLPLAGAGLIPPCGLRAMVRGTAAQGVCRVNLDRTRLHGSGREGGQFSSPYDVQMYRSPLG
jgi:hypothetical protein